MSARPNKTISKIQGAIIWLSKISGFFAALSFLLLALGIFSNVVMRGFTGQEIPAVTELSEFFFALGGVLGLAISEYKGGHVKSDALISTLPSSFSRIVKIFTVLVAFFWLVWMSYLLIEKSMFSYFRDELRYGLYPLPFWPVRLAVAFGVSVFCLQFMIRIMNNKTDKNKIF